MEIFKTPILVSLDDYYLNREQLKPGPDGTIDLEDIVTLDIAQFQEDLTRLLRGEEVELPRFDFIRQQRDQAEMSLRQLAKAADVSNPYLSQVERGLRRPSAEILGRIASGLRISAESLYVRAGFLHEREGDQAVTEAIAADQTLTERQRAVLATALSATSSIGVVDTATGPVPLERLDGGPAVGRITDIAAPGALLAAVARLGPEPFTVRMSSLAPVPA